MCQFLFVLVSLRSLSQQIFSLYLFTISIYLPSLPRLVLYNNQITDTTPLSALTGLKKYFYIDLFRILFSPLTDMHYYYTQTLPYTHNTHTTQVHTTQRHNRFFTLFISLSLPPLTAQALAGEQSNHRHNTTECSHWIDRVLFTFSFAFFFSSYRHALLLFNICQFVCRFLFFVVSLLSRSLPPLSIYTQTPPFTPQTHTHTQ